MHVRERYRLFLRSSFLITIALLALSGGAAFAQSAPRVTSYSPEQGQTGRLICPGSFPTDLTITNCEFTAHLRVAQWVTTSFTDQAMLGAVVYGAGAQIIQSPSEWGRTWGGYGDRIGVRYTQGAARGTAEFLVGAIMHDDPRHLSYKTDPHTKYGAKVQSCDDKTHTVTIAYYPVPAGSLAWKRIGHAFLDSVTVLRSNTCGNGHRWPALDRLAGVAAGAYGGYGWYPAAENRFANAAQRAGTSYGSTLLGSFYTEFSPEISFGLSWVVSRHKKKQVGP